MNITTEIERAEGFRTEEAHLVTQGALPEIRLGDSVPTAKPFRQKGRKYMSKRSGQAGQVFLRKR